MCMSLLLILYVLYYKVLTSHLWTEHLPGQIDSNESFWMSLDVKQVQRS